TALWVCILLGCAKQPAPTAAKAKQTIPPPSGKLLFGGDARAWVGSLGNMQDQNYCRARLKLPLNPNPAWQYEYTSAEFSGAAPTAILHFDGKLMVSALSPQLMQLDAASGKVLVNRDFYERDSRSNQTESFSHMYLSPTGRLVANDNTNRFYCFALDGLERLWTIRTQGGMENEASPIVSDTERIYTTWGYPATWNVHGVDIETGAEEWMYPHAAEFVGGVTLSRSGVMLCFARPNELRALSAADGMPIWTVAAGAHVQLAPIDEARQTVHLLLEDETLECRRLHDGALLWSYDWSNVLPRELRGPLAEKTGLAKIGYRNIELRDTGYCIGPDGSYLSALNGHVLHFSPEGKLLWTAKLGTVMGTIVLFDNALLATQFFAHPITSDPRESDAFNQVVPEWKQVTPADTTKHASGVIPDRQAWCRISALDLRSGAMLSSMEPTTLANSNICPAGSKVIFGGFANGGSRRRTPKYISAYEWLEP
ncbi:MAG: PQQ-like beta-propeller repeat protein, partial [bacterium]|nr:PQQ-like beta-propeller repeat protein [bacterium]